MSAVPLPVDPVQVYDVLTRARHKLFDWVRPLSQDQYTRTFPFGLGTLRLTLVEIAAVELYLSMRLREETLAPRAEWPINEARQPAFPDLEKVWAAQSHKTRETLSETTDWNRAVTSRVVLPDKTLMLTAKKSDIATQLLLHEVHHRAQAMAMLRQLGIAAQDLDYIGFVQRREETPR
jgi:uncharacterized damage-inducible protein DinB